MNCSLSWWNLWSQLFRKLRKNYCEHPKWDTLRLLKLLTWTVDKIYKIWSLRVPWLFHGYTKLYKFFSFFSTDNHWQMVADDNCDRFNILLVTQPIIATTTATVSYSYIYVFEQGNKLSFWKICSCSFWTFHITAK